MSLPLISYTNVMAPIVPDPKRIKTFKSEAAFNAWLRAHHARETELWLRIYKKVAGPTEWDSTENEELIRRLLAAR